MRKFFLFIAFIVSVVNASGAKLVEGSLDCIKGEKNIAVSLDCSKLVYKKNRPFQDFLDKAPRVDNWEEESLKYFFKKFNKETNEKVATIEFKTDGDDNDEITLRDPMKEAGKDLGSLFKKFLKKK